MTNKHGDFMWYELLTGDADAAQSFYRDVIGWSAKSADLAGMDYRLFSMGETMVAGLMKITPDMAAGGARPGWLGYIAVDDVDASTAKIKADGGAVHIPPSDIPNVGRFSMVADRQGAMFYVMRGMEEGTSTSFQRMTPGHCGWNELATDDPADALAFYTKHFGWTKGEAMNMGEMGDYQIIEHGEGAIGGMMKRRADGPPAKWTFYFHVADVDAAAERAKQRGGKIILGPMDVPGGDRVVMGADPQGAMFALVGPGK